MISHTQARYLRRAESHDLVENYADYTRGRFNTHDGIPVIIAARNEQEDLPATLISLAANSMEVHPIVVENGSNDETADRAKFLGCTVLHSTAAFKLAALQIGVKMLASEARTKRPILFTDADTLVGKYWAEAMAKRAAAQDNVARVTCGSVMIWHGPNHIVDSLRTVNILAKDAVSAVCRTSPIGRGSNMAVDFAGSSAALAAYNELDGRLFIGEEEAIKATITATGGLAVQAFSWETTVLGRGDRFTNLRDCVAMWSDRDFTNRLARYPEYQGIVPYSETQTIVSEPDRAFELSAPKHV